MAHWTSRSKFRTVCKKSGSYLPGACEVAIASTCHANPQNTGRKAAVSRRKAAVSRRKAAISRCNAGTRLQTTSWNMVHKVGYNTACIGQVVCLPLLRLHRQHKTAMSQTVCAHMRANKTETGARSKIHVAIPTVGTGEWLRAALASPVVVSSCPYSVAEGSVTYAHWRNANRKNCYANSTVPLRVSCGGLCTPCTTHVPNSRRRSCPALFQRLENNPCTEQRRTMPRNSGCKVICVDGTLCSNARLVCNACTVVVRPFDVSYPPKFVQPCAHDLRSVSCCRLEGRNFGRREAKPAPGIACTVGIVLSDEKVAIG